MTLVGLLVAVLIIGLIYYLITLIPLPDPFKTIVLVLFIIIVILWLLSSFGILGSGPIFHTR